MNPQNLTIPILVPFLLALLTFLLPSRIKWLRETVAVLGAAIVVYIAVTFFGQKETFYTLPWLGYGIDFELRLYQFSQFILLALSGFVFLITLYSTVKMAGHSRVREYYGYIFLTASLAAGATLANNFVPLIFFWEGLLITLYALINLGGKNAHRTAVKSFIIGGFCDFCMILGIAILWSQTGTLRMSDISVLPQGLLAVSFFLMMIGAIGKAGAMPFHTWIPDAAIDAPVSVMALIPGALEKLLGIYLLVRITLDFYKLEINSPFCITLMIIGAATIVLAVFMALIQKDLKKLLSYHAVSQVGYMILGIGTAVPIGIIGGIFHMINNAIYKSGLFLAAGSVEHQTGTTELKKLGGLYRVMPFTALGFLICAAAISGIWPLNGFVSKEMIFHGSYETGYTIFTIAAWLGAILTFASFLKAGHSVFFGPRNPETPQVKENKSPIYIPILVLAAICVVFGVYNWIPLKFFLEPILSGHLPAGETLNFSGHALALFNPIALISMGCLLIALGLHIFGFKRGGNKAYLVSEPIHHLPVLNTLYNWAEARVFDLYEQGIKFLQSLSQFLFKFVDRPIDFFYEKIVVSVGRACTGILKAAHNGYYANYLAWTIGGLVLIVWAIGALLK
ncbi:MAG: NADH-quinone oxidoreductase subunit L [Candidatus Aminicenantes bacterium]|nr:NADH-quinone oxidoreductase subunit L [Acidobacteriota bacterium]MBU4404865.1 NADH-quinone oxidoreductase subunit L [Acidobacteriota bacterium]MCG2812408.1 NADH-quinone oxidoreductase subunit L [Candidatus Aminicenantes bacterium]